jgi:hypothetical protein
MNRFSEWLKATNMTDVATLITQGLWIWGSIRFTGVAADLMLSESTHAESHHAIGYNLAIALLAAWTGKSSLGALSHWGNRKTSREYMDKQKDIEEAKSRRPPPVVESQGGDVNVTSERPAPTSERPAPVPAPPPSVDVTNRPANEPDVWRDDERGEPDPNLRASAGRATRRRCRTRTPTRHSMGSRSPPRSATSRRRKPSRPSPCNA